MAAIGWLSHSFPAFNKKIMGSFTAGLILALMVKANGLAPSPLWKPNTEDIELIAASWAKENTPKDATFFLPTTFTAFKYESERSSFVDYKAMIHHHDYLGQWQKRIEQVYGFKLGSKDKEGVLRKTMPRLPKGMNTQEHEVYLVTLGQNNDAGMKLVQTLKTSQDTVHIYHFAPDLN